MIHFFKINIIIFHSYIVTDSNFPPKLTVVGEIGRQGGRLSVAEFRIFISKVKNENFVRHGHVLFGLVNFLGTTALTSPGFYRVSSPLAISLYNPSMVRYDVI